MNYEQPKQAGYYNPVDHMAQNARAVGAGIDREQSPRLMMKLASLERTVHGLREAMGQLGEKLQPITRPVPAMPASERGIATQNQQSPVVEQIECIQNMLLDLTARVRNQIEEMDL